MSFSVIIPARYASERLPGKPLLDIAGMSMIERVYRCALQSDAKRVVIATDHADIFTLAQSIGARVVMTSVDHQSGTDRLAEVVKNLDLADDEVVVNVQGDEPLIPAAVINQVANNLIGCEHASASTLCEPITDAATIFNPNSVKVVKNKNGMAMYFSRAPIPWDRQSYPKQEPAKVSLQDAGKFAEPYISDLVQRHIGIYAYRVKLLKSFVMWPMSPIEDMEKLEQLRILDNGHQIHVEPACTQVPAGVDTQSDLDRVKAVFSNSPVA